ncbi:hypothetical protein B9T31_08730 [Acinetobacter sp. ANC 4558]|uniref:hypothetical protein n=1 Tax=Acinetobacter sp. ANC 4558 TaxID=1977876 RepID=UPI000A33D7F8|nr:hypothetical protein [Acinetobacter sp. ANC 4558]OTG86115.1 hypothetical protein B9T31_08730 [Acinetobacter sp. ANC 4558]
MDNIHNTASTQPRTSYEEEFVRMMDDIDTMIESSTNPVHRKILVNYRRHGLLEVSGRYNELLSPNMTVAEPLYRVFEGSGSVILTGMAEVRGFYEALTATNMLVMWTGKQKMAVNDWGFAGEAEFSQFVPGSLLGDNVFQSMDNTGATAGASEYDADAFYLIRRTLAFVWHYNSDGKMIGEHVYEDTQSKVITKVANSDVITAERARELLSPLIDKYGTISE